MRRIFFITGIVLLGIVSACRGEKEITEEKPRTKTMVIDAGEPATRTAVQVSGSDYSVTWSKGDLIAVAEIIEANFTIEGGPSASETVYSTELPADTEQASFSVTLADRTSAAENPKGGDFKYIGVYPPGSLYSVNWSGHNRADWVEKWGDTTTPDHAVLLVELPTYQNPRASSFDPNADLLVSAPVTSSSQPNNISMSFARVGTIAKITLKGLPAGKTVERGVFTFSEEWPGAYIVEYDPVLQKTGVFSKSSGRIDFYPQEVFVNDDGEAVIWLRTLSGTLRNWFKFEVSLADGGKGGGEPEKYEKRVDLSSLGRTISFPESGVTTFGVMMEKHYDLVMNLTSYEAAETSLTLNMHYDLAGKPHTTVQYGLIRFAPETVDPLSSVSLSTAATEDITYLTPDGEGNVSHTFTGLTPDTDYCYLPFIAVDGTEYHPEYSYISLHTLKHYSYSEPGLVDMGLPSGTKWATFNLGSNSPLSEGYYFAWGEVRPTESFTNSYSSKYWYQWRWDATGLARKYSTIAAYGQGDLMDMKTVLDAEDDAASVCLGGEWRTPTSADFKELFQNCTQSTVEGGYVFTSRINGNSITFPACGYYSGNAKVTDGETIMMTSSLFVDGISSRNSALCAKMKSPNAAYSETAGSTRGYMKYNVRPVKGGTRTGFEWTTHCSVSEISGGQAVVRGEYLVPEDLGNYKDYLYTVNLRSDISDYTSPVSISRNGSHTFTGLTPGTTYYYWVTWECKLITNTSQGLFGVSEVRSFVAE